MLSTVIKLSFVAILLTLTVSVESAAFEHQLAVDSLRIDPVRFYPELFEHLITEKYEIFDKKTNKFASDDFIRYRLIPKIGYRATELWLRACAVPQKTSDATVAYVAECSIAIVDEVNNSKY